MGDVWGGWITSFELSELFRKKFYGRDFLRRCFVVGFVNAPIVHRRLQRPVFWRIHSCLVATLRALATS